MKRKPQLRVAHPNVQHVSVTRKVTREECLHNISQALLVLADKCKNQNQNN